MRSNRSLSRDPFREFDALVRHAFGPGLQPAGLGPAALTPAAESHRDGDDAVIRLELPGLDVERDVSVEVTGRTPVVSGERRDERSEDDGQGRRLSEFRYGAFRRVFRLAPGVTAESVTASYDAGVLTLRVADAYAEPEGQRIAVTVATKATPVVTGEVAEPADNADNPDNTDGSHES